MNNHNRNYCIATNAKKREGQSWTILIPTVARLAHTQLMRPLLLSYHHDHQPWRTVPVFGYLCGRSNVVLCFCGRADAVTQVSDHDSRHFLGCRVLLHEVRGMFVPTRDFWSQSWFAGLARSRGAICIGFGRRTRCIRTLTMSVIPITLVSSSN